MTQKNRPDYIKRGLEDINNFSKLYPLLDGNDISHEDIIIIGSSSLALCGIRENQDIDFIPMPKEREKLLETTRGHSNYYEKKEKSASFGDVEMSRLNRYSFMGISDKELIRNEKHHIVVEDIKVIRPEIEFSKKFWHCREKDIRDLNMMIDQRLVAHPDWNWELVEITKPQINTGSDSILKDGIESLKRDGIKSTIQKGINKVR